MFLIIKLILVQFFLAIIMLVSGFATYEKICAQPSLKYFEKLTTHDGLSNNMVTDLLEDSRGFLWIATRNGLNRYDGTGCKVFHFSGNSFTQPSNNLVSILQLSESMLAIASEDGLITLNILNDQYQKKDFSTRFSEKEQSIWKPYINSISILEKDFRGNIWAATPVAIYRLDSLLNLKKLFRSHQVHWEPKKRTLPFVNKIIPLTSGEVIFWLSTGVFVWKKPEAGKEEKLTPVEKFEAGKFSFLKGYEYYNVFQSPAKNIILINKDKKQLQLINPATQQRAFCNLTFDRNDLAYMQSVNTIDPNWVALSFDRLGFSLIRVVERSDSFLIRQLPEKYFPEDNFNKFLVDKERNVWATTMLEGVIKFPFERQIFNEKKIPAQPGDEPKGYQISSFLKTGHHLLFGCYGNGLYEWNLINGKIAHYTFPASRLKEETNLVWNLRKGNLDTVWVGTQNGLFWFKTTTKRTGRISHPHAALLDSVPITTQFTDSYGIVWMGLGYGNGLARLDLKKNEYTFYSLNKGDFPFRYPLEIAEDSNGDLYFINDNVRKIVKWTRANERYETVVSAGSTLWQSLYIDKNNKVWFITDAEGLVTYDPVSHQVKNFTSGNEAANYFGKICSDPFGRIWMTSSNGIAFFNQKNKSYYRYTIGSSLKVTSTNAPLYFDTATGLLYSGFFKKIVFFSINEINNNKASMPLLITGLNVMDKAVDVPADRKLKLRWSEAMVTLYFTGVNLTSGKENRYAYKLGNDDWIEIGNQQEIRFAKLAPGNYDLYLKAARKGEGWSPKTEYLNIQVEPPFTATVWFYLICILLASLLFFGWHKVRVNKLLQVKKIRNTISADLHDELGSKLTNLSFMSLIARKKLDGNSEVRELLEKISDDSMQASSSLREIVWGIKPALDKPSRLLPRLTQYMAETLEMQNIEFTSSSDDIPAALKLKPGERRDLELIIKEAVANIIKHSQASHARLLVSYKKRLITIRIQDDGKGILHKTSGNGIRNMQERAKAHNWKLEFISQSGEGCTLALEIKIT